MSHKEPLTHFEKMNLKGSPRNAATALAMFKIICKQQKTTPVCVGNTPEGILYTLKEFPTFKAHFKIHRVIGVTS